MRGLDHWITSIPDDGHRLEKCDWCNGTGVRHVVTNWHGYPQDGEAECDECGGSGQIEYGPDGYPRAAETTTDRYFRRLNQETWRSMAEQARAKERSHVASIVDATIRSASIMRYPWATARVALTAILVDLERRVGDRDAVLEPLRAYIAGGDGRVK